MLALRRFTIGIVVAIAALMVVPVGALSPPPAVSPPASPTLSNPAGTGLLSRIAPSTAPAPTEANGLTSAPSGSAAGVHSLESASKLPHPSSQFTSPHLGTLDVYEVAPGGGLTEDPSVTQDSLSYEPVQNTYETLVNYDGPSTSSFVPTLATCVPGTSQCGADYPGAPGTNLVVSAAGQPVDWTFVIDPYAKFYDTDGASWSVYPTDAMFSVLRTMAFANLPFVGAQNGWTIAQALLPSTGGTGIHQPYVNTPANELDSMLINDSNYCPADATDGVHGHGCITFVADGSSRTWSSFLELVADGLGASVVPCGWFTFENAGIPGWSGTAAPHGDGPCLLPDGGTTTENPAWASYVGGLSTTYWDTFEELALNTPAVQPGVQWNLVGSGPYYASINVGIGYTLQASPAYAQPSACSGDLAFPGQYASVWCDPAPGSYMHTVNVYWEASDSAGIAAATADTADFEEFEPSHTPTMLALQGEQKVDVYPPTAAAQDDPTHLLSTYLAPFNLNWSATAYVADALPGPLPYFWGIPSDFFSAIAARGLLVSTYPYATAENSLWTVAGTQWLQNSEETVNGYQESGGGPIPPGLGPFYDQYAGPSTAGAAVQFPTGNPDLNPADVGGAAWWWAQGTNPISPYFSVALAACTPTSPCVFPLEGELGNPTEDTAISDWVTSIESITGNALRPFTFDLNLVDTVTAQADQVAGNGPLPAWTSGWTGNYFDPEAYIAPTAYPDDTFTASDAVAEQLALPAYNLPGCGFPLDLSHWASVGPIVPGCQGVAYSTAVAGAHSASTEMNPLVRIQDYDLVEQILNNLSLYLWIGQPNDIVTEACWIDTSTIDTNPLIGGYGDPSPQGRDESGPLWFHIRYVSPENSSCNYTVTFNETGLPKGTTWDVTLTGVNTTSTLTSNNASITFTGLDDDTTHTFSVSSPAGYTASPSSGNVTVSGRGGNETYVTIVFSGGPCCAVAATPVVGQKPAGEAYDPGTNQVFVSNWGYGPPSNVTVLSGNYPYHGVASVKVGSFPNGEAYDPVTNTVWVTNWGSDTISEICDGTPTPGTGCALASAADTVVQTLNVGNNPYDIAYDSQSQVMAVTNRGSDTVTLIPATTTGTPTFLTVLFSTAPPGPVGVAYDQYDDEFFVTQPANPLITGCPTGCVYAVYMSAGVWVHSAPITLPPSSFPFWLAWDSRTDQLFISDEGTNSVDVLHAFPGGGTLITASGYPISLSPETEPNAVAYDAPCNEVFVVDDAGSNVVSVISDLTDTVVTTVPVGVSPFGVVYDYGATYESVNGGVFVSNYGQNSSVEGNGTVSVIFCAFCANETNLTPVTFVPMGLPAGSSWDVEVSTYGGTELMVGSALSPAPIGFEVPGGSLPYSFSSPTGYGIWKVSGAPPGTTGSTLTSASISGVTVLNVYFRTVLTCHETGLPPGTLWDCKITGRGLSESKNSTGTSINFTVPNGTYRFTISKLCFYAASPLSGRVVVNGATTVNVVFTVLTKLVAFKETGLPAGTRWSVTVTGPETTPPFATVTTTYFGTTPTITIETVCGTYNWSAPSVVVNGHTYIPTPASGSFVIRVTGNTIRKVPGANPIRIKYRDPRPRPAGPLSIRAAPVPIKS